MEHCININEDHIFEKGDTIIVGCSGGSDSMALFSLLLELRKDLDLKLVCAHVNHNVRKESEEELVFLDNYCQKRKVVFESMIIQQYGEDNFHNEARSIRYRFFKDLADKYHAKYIVTAHHADDLMETILMRVVRGSTLKGYGGFSKILNQDGYCIVRPLISYTKDDLLTYVKQHDIPYREDSSNHKMYYTRNRYRKYVLPFLKKENALVHKKFLKFSNIVHEANDYIEQQVIVELNKIYNDKILDIEGYKKLNSFIKKEVLYKILEDIYEDDLLLISDQHINLLQTLLEKENSRPNGHIHLPNNIIAVKNYKQLSFEPEPNNIVSYEIELSQNICLSKHHGKKISFVEVEESDGNDVCRLDSKTVELPLIVRTRHDGDTMDLLGTNGKKKLKNIFIDKKIPVGERDTWPIVIDSKDRIVWLPGLQKSKFSKTKRESYDIILKYH